MPKLAFLGTGTCNSNINRPQSFALSVNDEIILIDCGGGAFHTISKLNDNDFAYNKIKSIFLTHYHIDHVSGLPDFFWGKLWDKMFDNFKISPVELYGPEGLIDFYKKRFIPFMGVDNFPFELKLYELSDNFKINNNYYSVETFKMKHSDSSLAYLFTINNLKIAITGDTGYCENLELILSKSDIAIIELSITDDDYYDQHLNFNDIVNLLKKGLLPDENYFVHIYPSKFNVFSKTTNMLKQKLESLNPDKKYFFPVDKYIINL